MTSYARTRRTIGRMDLNRWPIAKHNGLTMSEQAVAVPNPSCLLKKNRGSNPGFQNDQLIGDGQFMGRPNEHDLQMVAFHIIKLLTGNQHRKKTRHVTYRSSNLKDILQNVHPWYPLPPESLEIGWSCRSAGRAQTTWLNGKDLLRSASRVLHFDSSTRSVTWQIQLLVISGDLWSPMNCFQNVTLLNSLASDDGMRKRIIN